MHVYAITLHFGDGGAFYTEETIKLYALEEDAKKEKERLEGVRTTNRRFLNLAEVDGPQSPWEKERSEWWSNLDSNDMAAANCDWVSIKKMEVIWGPV